MVIMVIMVIPILIMVLLLELMLFQIAIQMVEMDVYAVVTEEDRTFNIKLTKM